MTGRWRLAASRGPRRSCWRAHSSRWRRPLPNARKLSTLDHLTRGRVGWNVVTGYSDSAARNYGLARRERELIEAASPEGLLVDLSAKLGLDLSRYDLDAPLDDLHAPGVQGIIEQLKARGDGHATLRAALPRLLAARFTGTVEEIADELQCWRDAGIDGFNVMDVPAHSAFWEFAERLAPWRPASRHAPGPRSQGRAST